MKRILAVLLCMAMLLSLAGCSSTVPEDVEPIPGERALTVARISHTRFQKQHLLADFLHAHAQCIPVGLASLIMDCFKNATAFSNPSSVVIRLSSCSMLITRS